MVPVDYPDLARLGTPSGRSRYVRFVRSRAVTRSYVLRTLTDLSPTTFVAEIEDVLSGERSIVKSVEELVAWLLTHGGGRGTPES